MNRTEENIKMGSCSITNRDLETRPRGCGALRLVLSSLSLRYAVMRARRGFRKRGALSSPMAARDCAANPREVIATVPLFSTLPERGDPLSPNHVRSYSEIDPRPRPHSGLTRTSDLFLRKRVHAPRPGPWPPEEIDNW